MEISEFIELWLNENNYSFTKINEPEEFFHYIVKYVEIKNLPVEIYQKKDFPIIFIGSQTRMTDKFFYEYVKFTNQDRENFEKKINGLLNRFGIPHVIYPEKSSFVISIIAQIPIISFNKDILVETIESVKNANVKCVGLADKILKEYRKQNKN